MALCVALAVDGTLVPTGEPVEECAGYVLVSASEHGFYSFVHQAFSVPSPEEAMQWFVAPFGMVITFYVLAHAAGRVAGMFNR